MVHALSPAVPVAATARVREMSEREGWDLREMGAGEFADPDYRANPYNRCYFCKSNLYRSIRTITDRRIASGANLDDLSDYRPGLQAAAERGVVHPFVEAAIDKKRRFDKLRACINCTTTPICRRSPARPAASKPACRSGRTI